jgi:hypothetical protein
MTEMVVVSFLTTLLAMTLSTVWLGFCRPARDAATRCRLATEANLAAFALARDLGGDLTDVRIIPDPFPTAAPDQTCLQLSYQNPDTTVSYRLEGHRLVRNDLSGDVTLAGELVAYSAGGSGFDLSPWSDGSGNEGVLLVLTFASLEENGNYRVPDGAGNMVERDLSLTYRLVAAKPTAF